MWAFGLSVLNKHIYLFRPKWKQLFRFFFPIAIYNFLSSAAAARPRHHVMSTRSTSDGREKQREEMKRTRKNGREQKVAARRAEPNTRKNFLCPEQFFLNSVLCAAACNALAA